VVFGVYGASHLPHLLVAQAGTLGVRKVRVIADSFVPVRGANKRDSIAAFAVEQERSQAKHLVIRMGADEDHVHTGSPHRR
jgi:hypothetical protein